MTNESRTEQTKTLIIDSSLSLFEKDGYDDVRIMDIVDEAEISRMTFFRYFPAKADVIASQINFKTLLGFV